MNFDIRVSRNGLALLACITAAAVYINSIGNGFALDDVYIVQLNGRAHDPTNLARIWLTPYWPFQGQELGLYRPLAIFLFALQWAAGGGDPVVFHAVSVVLHALVVLLAFLLLERLTDRTAAFVGALVFAVHPVHTEAVANVVGQAEVVAAGAVLAGCVLHASRPAGVDVAWTRRLALTCCFLIALAAKESAVVFPALLVLLDFAQNRVRLSGHGMLGYVRAMAMAVFMLSAALAFYLIIRFDVMGGSLVGSNAAPAMPFLREEYRLLNALRAFPEFLRLLFVPYGLSADYSPAVILPVEDVRPMVILGALLLIVVVILAALTPWYPAVGFPAGWFFIAMVTVSNLFFPIGVLIAERTLYLPSFAVSALVAYAWHHAAAQQPCARSRPLWPALAAVVVVLMGVRTWIRNPEWRNTNTIWEATTRDHPESYRSQWVRASWLNAAGQTDRAEAHYRLAHRIYPRDTQFSSDFANFLMSRGNYGEAVALLEQAHEVAPLTAFSASLLAHAYVATGRYEEVPPLLLHAESMGATLATSMALRAYAYRGMGDQDRAAGAWRTAVRHSAESRSRAWMFLARSLAFGGHAERAGAALDSALATAPDAATAATVDRVRAALDGGCYDADGAHVRPLTGFARMRQSACDPLGEWFEFVPEAHIATPLQNARRRAAPGLEPAGHDNPE